MTTILFTLLCLAIGYGVKLQIEKNILIDECSDCKRRLDESAQNTYKSEYVHGLQEKVERLENYLLNHNPLEL